MRSWEAVTFSVTPPPANSRHGRPRKKASGSISSRLEELARPKSVNPRRSMGLSTSLSMQSISSPRTAPSASPRRSQSTSPSMTHKIAAYNAQSGPLDVALSEPAKANHSGPWRGGATTHPPSPPKPSYRHGTSRDFASPPPVAHGIGGRVDIMPANRLAAEDLVERWNEWMKSGSVIASTATANGRGTASMFGHETPRSPTSSVTSFADQPPTVTASPIHSYRSPQSSPRAVGKGLAGGHDRVNRTWDAGGAGSGGGAAASPPWMSVPSGRSIPQADPGTPSASGKQVLLPLLQHEQAARRDAESEVCKLQGQLNKVMDERLRGDNEALWKHKQAKYEWMIREITRDVTRASDECDLIARSIREQAFHDQARSSRLTASLAHRQATERMPTATKSSPKLSVDVVVARSPNLPPGVLAEATPPPIPWMSLGTNVANHRGGNSMTEESCANAQGRGAASVNFDLNLSPVMLAFPKLGKGDGGGEWEEKLLSSPSHRSAADAKLMSDVLGRGQRMAAAAVEDKEKRSRVLWRWTHAHNDGTNISTCHAFLTLTTIAMLQDCLSGFFSMHSSRASVQPGLGLVSAFEAWRREAHVERFGRRGSLADNDSKHEDGSIAYRHGRALALMQEQQRGMDEKDEAILELERRMRGVQGKLEEYESEAAGLALSLQGILGKLSRLCDRARPEEAQEALRKASSRRGLDMEAQAAISPEFGRALESVRGAESLLQVLEQVVTEALSSRDPRTGMQSGGWAGGGAGGGGGGWLEQGVHESDGRSMALRGSKGAGTERERALVEELKESLVVRDSLLEQLHQEREGKERARLAAIQSNSAPSPQHASPRRRSPHSSPAKDERRSPHSSPAHDERMSSHPHSMVPESTVLPRQQQQQQRQHGRIRLPEPMRMLGLVKPFAKHGGGGRSREGEALLRWKSLTWERQEFVVQAARVAGYVVLRGARRKWVKKEAWRKWMRAWLIRTSIQGEV